MRFGERLIATERCTSTKRRWWSSGPTLMESLVHMRDKRVEEVQQNCTGALYVM